MKTKIRRLLRAYDVGRMTAETVISHLRLLLEE